MQHGLARALERERRARIATEEASRLRHDLMVSVLDELRVPAEAIAACAARLDDRTIERHARAQCRVIANLLELARPGGAAANEPLLSGVRVLVAGVDGEGAPCKACCRSPAPKCASPRARRMRSGPSGSWQPDVLLSDLGEGGDSLIRELRALPAERGGCLRAAALSGGRHEHRRL